MFYWWLWGSYIPIVRQNIAFCDIYDNLKIFKKGPRAPNIVEKCFVDDFQGLTYLFWVKILNFVMFVKIWNFSKKGPGPPKLVKHVLMVTLRVLNTHCQSQYCILWCLWKFENFQKGPGHRKLLKNVFLMTFRVLHTYFE